MAGEEETEGGRQGTRAGIKNTEELTTPSPFRIACVDDRGSGRKPAPSVEGMFTLKVGS